MPGLKRLKINLVPFVGWLAFMNANVFTNNSEEAFNKLKNRITVIEKANLAQQGLEYLNRAKEKVVVDANNLLGKARKGFKNI